MLMPLLGAAQVDGKAAEIKNRTGKETSDSPLRILCLGDSITVGYTDNPIWKEPFKFGYRSGLYSLLKGAGYTFIFVGNSPQPWNKLSGDPAHGGSYTPAFDLRDLGQDKHQGGGRGHLLPPWRAGWRR